MGVHEDLKKSVSAVKASTKNSPFHFAYVAKGSDGALIVSRGNVSGGVIAAAKKEIGGTAVFGGKCFMENGALVLETAGNPPATLATGVRACLAKHAGLTLQVVGRAAGAGEEEGNEQEGQQQGGGSQSNSSKSARGNSNEEEGNEEESEQPRTQAQGGGSRGNSPQGSRGNANANAKEEEEEESEQQEKTKIAAKVKAIQPRLQAALKGGQGGNAAKALFDKAASLYRANEFEEAEEELEQLDKVLKGLGK